MEKEDRRGLPVYWKHGKITVSGLLECLKHCSGYYGAQACCDECPGMSGGKCVVDTNEECIKYLEHQADIKRTYQKKYQAQYRAQKAKQKK